MEGLTNTIKIPSGRVMTLQEYFERNPQSVHTLNGVPGRTGVIINGAIVEIGSIAWQNICQVPIFQDKLFGGLSFIHYKNKHK